MSTTVWRLPCKSQECDQGPVLRQDVGDQLVLAYDFERESGEYGWEEIVFTGTVAFTFTAARHCSAEQVGAYDRIETVDRSAWARGVPNVPPGLRHYRIFFDDVGCYEVLATGFVPPLESV